MTRFLTFGLALLAVCALAGESQAFGRRAKSGCSGGSCGTVFSGGCGASATTGCVGNKCDLAPATTPTAPPTAFPPKVLPKAPSSVGGYPEAMQTGGYGDLRPGMTIMTPNGPGIVTWVGQPMPAQTATPSTPAIPPTIRKLPEPQPTTQPQPDDRPKAPRSDRNN